MLLSLHELSCIISFSPYHRLFEVSAILQFFFFLDEETKPQRDQVTCPGPLSYLGQELDCKSMSVHLL